MILKIKRSLKVGNPTRESKIGKNFLYVDIRELVELRIFDLRLPIEKSCSVKMKSAREER